MAQDPRIQHLLRRAGFGATAAEAARYSQMGIAATIQEVLDFTRLPDDVDSWFPAPEAFSPSTVINDARHRWLFRMRHTWRPLQEKMACSGTTIRDGLQQGRRTCVAVLKRADDGCESVGASRGTARQLELFRAYALPTSATCSGSRQDPAMLVWLMGPQYESAAPETSRAKSWSVHHRRRPVRRGRCLCRRPSLHRVEFAADRQRRRSQQLLPVLL